MRNSIFNKAKQIVKYCVFQASTNFEEYYNFHFPNTPKEKDIQVALHQGIRGTFFDCTCKYHSVKDVHMKNLCSYVLAVMKFKLK